MVSKLKTAMKTKQHSRDLSLQDRAGPIIRIAEAGSNLVVMGGLLPARGKRIKTVEALKDIPVKFLENDPAHCAI